MLKRVDKVEDDLEGFSYLNQDGDVEAVRFYSASMVDLVFSGENVAAIYIHDIPNMVKALTATYKHHTGGVV